MVTATPIGFRMRRETCRKEAALGAAEQLGAFAFGSLGAGASARRGSPANVFAACS
jgi:hypothetical protein